MICLMTVHKVTMWLTNCCSSCWTRCYSVWDVAILTSASHEIWDTGFATIPLMVHHGRVVRIADGTGHQWGHLTTLHHCHLIAGRSIVCSSSMLPIDAWRPILTLLMLEILLHLLPAFLRLPVALTFREGQSLHSTSKKCVSRTLETITLMSSVA